MHAIVLVSKIHKPTLRALAYARATRPSILEALTVDVDPDETKALQAEWDRRDIPVPLKALDSPFREITRPIVDYVKSIRSGNPRDLVVVYIPQYVLGHWWEQILHNQSALRLKGRLLFTPGGHGVVGPVAAGLGGGLRGPAGRPGRRRRPPRRGLMAEPHGSGLAVGDEVEVDVTAIAHGGHCIARHDGPGPLRAPHDPRRAGARPGHRDRCR